MARTITITTERIRRVVVRYWRSPGVPDAAPVTAELTAEETKPEKGKTMHKKLIVAFAFMTLSAVPARPQGPPFVAGLQLPSKVAFTRYGNLVVAESGTQANNSGRLSLVDRATATRRTLIEGLPSGLSRAEGTPTPSGPSGIAVQDSTIYVTIGSGDAVLPGPAAGSEQRNESPASPILASLLSLRSSVPFDVTAGGFVLNAADHAMLKSGAAIALHNSAGEDMVVKLIADFPDYTEEPRPDFPANVRAGNPFGVTALGQTLYVVDASQNLVRRVDANTGQTTTLTTIGKVQNPTPVGAPVIDPVPDSIHLRGSDLVVTTLTGFPFPAGKAEVRRIRTSDGVGETLIAGLTSAIDSAPLGGSDALLVLEFSTNMLQSAPGRLRLMRPSGESTTIAEGLPTPTSMAVDQTTGDVFITHIFPGFITRIPAAALLPAPAPTAIVPVVVSQAGAFNSQYTTQMQIGNPYPFAISGRIVVHPAATSGAATDASVSYSLAPFETRSVASVIASGGGSADVLAAGGAAPVVVTTIVDTNSKQSVNVPTLRAADALSAGMRGTLLTPADPARQRFNIGIRTLGEGVNVTIRLYDSAGKLLSTITRPFNPHYFQQFSFTDLLGVPAGANQSVTFEVLSGSAIVYGAAIDNASGAMTLQIAEGVE